MAKVSTGLEVKALTVHCLTARLGSARAAEIARNKDVYPTWKENCRVLNQAAKEIERLREEIKQLRSGYK